MASFCLMSACLFFSTIEESKAQERQTPILTETNKTPLRSVFSGTAPADPNSKGAVATGQAKMMTCGTQATYRSIDGQCNNITNMNWGAAHTQVSREIPAEYGLPDSFNDLGGQNRPNPRVISNEIFKKNPHVFPSATLSSFVFSWGQFLDHDISVSPESENPPEFANILPSGEPNDPIISPITFHRSEVFPGTGVSSPREQENAITSWIDGSQVYGSDQARATWLRQGTHGKLKTSAGDLLPYNTFNGEKTGVIDPNAPFMADQAVFGILLYPVAGDVRANEQSSLTALHTLFVREHNRFCDDLIATNGYSPIVDDQLIYLEARKKVIALLQHITFNEFLPAIDVHLAPYAGYNNSIQPDIINGFSTAAYRLGHTMVPSELLLVDNNGNNVGTGSVSLIAAFFDPTIIENNGIDPVLKGLAIQHQEEIDFKIVEELRSFLFGPGAGLDLASLNIQRGRDHGLADYNTYRNYFTGDPAASFADITIKDTLAADLAVLYGDIDDMDLWVGLLSEDKAPNDQLGVTLQVILGEQFTRLRDGDYYFYLNDPACAGDLATIQATLLSDIIKRNTNLTNIQDYVFYPTFCNPSITYTSADNVNAGDVLQTIVSNDIQASNAIQASGMATYNAGYEITLQPGFESVCGSDFWGFIDGCGGILKTDHTTPPNIKEDEAIAAANFALQCYPNPFTKQTTIFYTLSEPKMISLSVYSPTGQEITRLIEHSQQQAGSYEVQFDGQDLPKGVYFYRLVDEKGSVGIGKMILN